MRSFGASFRQISWIALTVALAGCEDAGPSTKDAGPIIEDASAVDSGDSGETNLCSGEADTERENGEVTRARLARDWEYRTEAATEACLNPCDTCVGIAGDEGAGNHCSVLCESDDECESDQTCFGCWDLKACVKRCDSTDDCDFDETCEAGVCLWQT